MAAAAPALPFSKPIGQSPYQLLAAIKNARVLFCDLKTRKEDWYHTFTKAERDMAEEIVHAGRHGQCGISIRELAAKAGLKSLCWTRELVRNIEEKTRASGAMEIFARNRAEQKVRGKRGGYRNWYAFSLEGLHRLNPYYKPKRPAQPKPQPPVPEKVKSYEQSSTFVRSQSDRDRANSIVNSVVQRFWKNSNTRPGGSIFGISFGPATSPAPARHSGGNQTAEVPSSPSRDSGNRPGDPNGTKGPPG